jgi:hypothetical protein
VQNPTEQLLHMENTNAFWCFWCHIEVGHQRSIAQRDRLQTVNKRGHLFISPWLTPSATLSSPQPEFSAIGLPLSVAMGHNPYSVADGRKNSNRGVGGIKTAVGLPFD